MKTTTTCRRVRSWLQEQHDREGAGPQAARQAGGASPAGGRAAAQPLESRQARAAAAHLEECPDCRRFREFLSSFGRELRACLDAPMGAQPGAASAIRRPVAVREIRPPARAARPPFLRWAIPAAAAALVVLAVGTQAPRLAAGASLQRSIRAETAALVEELFSRPLAQDVELGLAGGSLLEELEGLAEGDGLQGLGEGEPELSAGLPPP